MPPKGNNNNCGKTSEPCIDESTFGKDNTYFEGSVCLLRKECVKRDQCVACETDLDCSLIPGRTCVQSGAAKHCLRTCLVTKDCPDATSCVSGSCQPLYKDQCEGKGDFCAPCVSDEDCGSKGTSLACAVANDLTNEHGCLDLSFSTSCMADADCPLSPGNRHGHCLNENDGLTSADKAYHKCYFPFKPDAGGGGKFTCGK
jgi:hypothetical protein